MQVYYICRLLPGTPGPVDGVGKEGVAIITIREGKKC